ncbi:MAG: EamA family transporter, partial [Rhodospirillales bacterium]|nr:EamA family transporter [Rhodospirillales bacterium]
VFVQLGAAAAVNLFPAIGPQGAVALRVGFTAIILCGVLRPSLQPLMHKSGLVIYIYGAMIAGMNICFYEALSRIPLAIAVSIAFMGPLVLAIASSRKLHEFVWVVLALVGIGLMLPEIGISLDPVGVGFALLDALGWIGFIVLSKRISNICPGNSGLALGMGVAAVIMLPFGLMVADKLIAQPYLLVLGFVVSMFSTAIPFTLEFEALKKITPRVYGVLVTLEPCFAVVVGAVILGDQIEARALLAIGCVFVASLGATLFNKGHGGG